MIRLIGHFGKKNFGDDLMLESYIKNFTCKDEIYEIWTKNAYYNFKNKNISQRLIPNLKSIEFVRSFSKIKKVIWCGGTIFYDNGIKNSIKNIIWIFLITMICRCYKIDIHFKSIGVGLIKFKLSYLIIKCIINFNNTYFTVRDKNSKTFFKNITNKSISLEKDLCLVNPDKSFHLSSNQLIIAINNDDFLDEEKIKNLYDWIIINVNCKLYSSIIIIDYCEIDKGTKLFNYFKDDNNLKCNLKYLLYNYENLSQIIEYYKKGCTVISFRYHALIYAILFKCNFINPCHNSKCKEISLHETYSYKDLNVVGYLGYVAEYKK